MEQEIVLKPGQSTEVEETASNLKEKIQIECDKLAGGGGKERNHLDEML